MVIKAIIFDLWDTLVFSEFTFKTHKKFQSVLKISSKEKFWELWEKTCCLKRVKDKYEMISNLCELAGFKNNEKLINNLIEIWDNEVYTSPIYPEAISVLKKLKEKYKLALISNTEQISAEYVIEKYNLKEYFDVIILSCDVGSLKPNPKIFKIALKKLKTKPGETLMVGDSFKNDIIGAKKLRIKTVWINRKNKTLPNTKEADFIIKNLTELIPILEKLEEKK